jgi:hypothetical protein
MREVITLLSSDDDIQNLYDLLDYDDHVQSIAEMVNGIPDSDERSIYVNMLAMTRRTSGRGSEDQQNACLKNLLEIKDNDDVTTEIERWAKRPRSNSL